MENGQEDEKSTPAKEVSAPIPSGMIVATQEDYAELLRRNPLAASQLEGIIWKRMYLELSATPS